MAGLQTPAIFHIAIFPLGSRCPSVPSVSCTGMVTTIVMLNCVVILTLIALGPELIFHPLVTDTPAPAPYHHQQPASQWGNAGHRYSLPAPRPSCPNKIKLEPFEHSPLHPTELPLASPSPCFISTRGSDDILVLCQFHPTSRMGSSPPATAETSC